MLKSIKTSFILLTFFLSTSMAFGQVVPPDYGIGNFGIGFTFTDDIYNRYANEPDGIAHRGNGNVLLTLGLGPKIWIGGEKFSISAEGTAVYGITGLASSDYKGMGSLAFPFMAKLNFGGLSGLNRNMGYGFSLGGGIQYSKTEIYGLSQDYIDQGVTRDYFKTYNIQVGGGGGISGFTAQLFARYGFNPDMDVNNLHIGLQFDFNLIGLKKIKRPESEL